MEHATVMRKPPSTARFRSGMSGAQIGNMVLLQMWTRQTAAHRATVAATQGPPQKGLKSMMTGVPLLLRLKP